jgi:endonuclease YncB( thermonuclease family)
MAEQDTDETELGDDRKQRRRRHLQRAGFAACVVLVAAGLWQASTYFQPSRPTIRIDSMFTSAHTRSVVSGYDSYTGVTARPMPPCEGGAHRNCVVDGDTIWINGAKIRLANVDAPETDARCANEERLAGEARRTLSRLVSGQPIVIHAQGRDRQGRLLARLSTPRGDVGERLIGWEIAVPWQRNSAAANPWCD